jgi:ADP-ribosylglycohydrolase
VTGLRFAGHALDLEPARDARHHAGSFSPPIDTRGWRLIAMITSLPPDIPQRGRVDIGLSDDTTFTDLAIITEFHGNRAVSPRGIIEMRGTGGRPIGVLGERYTVPALAWRDAFPRDPDLAALADRCVGSLVAGAIGDGLGGPVERLSAAEVRARYVPDGVTDLPPEGARWSDDTQLTVVVAQSLIASAGRFDPADFVARLVEWLPTGRGIGSATRRAVEALATGEPWESVGPKFDSSGNGAAMRTAPVGLVHALGRTPTELLAEAVRFALPTHGGAVGVAGAVAMAAGVGYLARRAVAGETSLSPEAFAGFVAYATSRLEPVPTPTRRPPGRPEFLRDRLRAIPRWLARPPAEVFDEIWTGAFALESVPAAIYAFLRSPDNPRAVLLTAANAGHDSDTIASMAGNLVGAWLGASRMARAVPEWWSRVERREEIEALAEQLADIAARPVAIGFGGGR